MTAFMRAFLICDGCSKTLRTVAIPPDFTIHEARAAARDHGWTYPLRQSADVRKQRHIDLCDNCSPEGTPTV
jgi:hypothetical protein